MQKIASGAGATAESTAKATQVLRQLYGCFPTGVTALCALKDGAPIGLALSSFTSVSLDPPLVSVSLQSTSSTWAALDKVTTFGLSVLSETQDGICRQMSMKNGDRFENVAWTAMDSGAVLIDGAVAWLECSLHHRFAAGDHEVAILKVDAARADPEQPPLVFHGSRFRKLVAHDERIA